MLWRTVQSNWSEFSQRVIEHWPDLDFDRVYCCSGNQEALIRYMSQTLEITLFEALDEIELLMLKGNMLGAVIAAQEVPPAFTAKSLRASPPRAH